VTSIRTLLVVIGTLVTSRAALQAQPTADAIAPFLDEATVAVVRVDVERIEPAALAKLVQSAASRPEATDRFAAYLTTLRTQLRDLGATEVFAVYSLHDVVGQSPYLLVPARDSAAATRLAAWVFSGDPNGPTSETPGRAAAGAPGSRFEVSAPIGTVVVCGSRTVWTRIRNGEGPARPTWKPALAATADAAISLTVAPTADQRRVIAEMLPKLPDDVGGLSGAELAAGVQWLASAIDPASQSLSVTIESADEGAAQRLAGGLPRLAAAVADWALPADRKGSVILQPRAVGKRVTFTVGGTGEPRWPLVDVLVDLLIRVGNRYDATKALQEIALALHKFHDTWQSFPPPASYDGDKPLLSWRVHVLPYLNENDLYGQFHLNEPWDSEHNRQLISKMPDIYKSDFFDLNMDGKTTFVVPVAPETIFHGTVGTPIREIMDGTSNTIMVLQADPDRAVIWTKPDDLAIEWQNVKAGLTGDGRSFPAVFGDGALHRLPVTIPEETLKRLLMHQDGQPVDWSQVH
jgi:hypothetical protein